MKRRGRIWITALLVAAFLLIYVPKPVHAEPEDGAEVGSEDGNVSVTGAETGDDADGRTGVSADALTIQGHIFADGMSISEYTEEQAKQELQAREDGLQDVTVKMTSEYGDVETTLGELGYYGDERAAFRSGCKAGYP